MAFKDTSEQRDSRPFYSQRSKNPTITMIHESGVQTREKVTQTSQIAWKRWHQAILRPDLYLQHFKDAGLQDIQWLSLLDSWGSKRFMFLFWAATRCLETERAVRVIK